MQDAEWKKKMNTIMPYIWLKDYKTAEYLLNDLIKEYPQEAVIYEKYIFAVSHEFTKIDVTAAEKTMNARKKLIELIEQSQEEYYFNFLKDIDVYLKNVSYKLEIVPLHETIRKIKKTQEILIFTFLGALFTMIISGMVLFVSELARSPKWFVYIIVSVGVLIFIICGYSECARRIKAAQSRLDEIGAMGDTITDI